jgi:hypothetical protein
MVSAWRIRPSRGTGSRGGHFGDAHGGLSLRDVEESMAAEHGFSSHKNYRKLGIAIGETFICMVLFP